MAPACVPGRDETPQPRPPPLPGSAVCSPAARHRLRAANACAVLTSLICVVFAVVNAARGMWSGVAVDAFAAVLMAAALLVLRRTQRPELFLAFVVPAYVAFEVVVGPTGAMQAYLWLYGVPLLVFFLGGLRLGLPINVFLLLLTTSLSVLYPPARVLPGVQVSVFFSLLFVVGLSAVYETTRLAYEEELARLSHTDVLTGVGNRRCFLERLAAEVTRARRHGGPLSVVLVDVDRFKQVNDTHGHGVGDAALAHVARSLVIGTRGSDLACRIGGDEFAVLAPEAALADAAALAERLRQAVGETPDGAPAVTVTLGVAELAPGDTPESLLARADAGLYRAKASGRNRVGVEAAPAVRPRLEPSPPSPIRA